MQNSPARPPRPRGVPSGCLRTVTVVSSSVQIAVFVAPVLVLASYAIGPYPMNLVFTPPEVLAVALAVIISGQISSDGESNWLEGVQLLAVYTILAFVFYFLPEVPHAP